MWLAFFKTQNYLQRIKNDGAGLKVIDSSVCPFERRVDSLTAMQCDFE